MPAGGYFIETLFWTLLHHLQVYAILGHFSFTMRFLDKRFLAFSGTSVPHFFSLWDDHTFTYSQPGLTGDHRDRPVLSLFSLPSSLLFSHSSDASPFPSSPGISRSPLFPNVKCIIPSFLRPLHLLGRFLGDVGRHFFRFSYRIDC